MPEAKAKYCPICLLNEIGKLLEQVVAGRIENYPATVKSDLDDLHYGFRRKRSIMDALRKVRKTVTAATEAGGRAMAINLDIANAFNSLRAIQRILQHHRIPVFLRWTIATYLSKRSSGIAFST